MHGSTIKIIWYLSIRHSAFTAWNWRWHQFGTPKLLCICQSTLHNISENLNPRQHHRKDIKSRINHKILRNFFSRLAGQWKPSLHICVEISNQQSAISNVVLKCRFFCVLIFFLCAFAKLRKATINSVTSVCLFVKLSVRPSAWTLSMDGFQWLLIFEYFSKIRRGNVSFTKICQK
jgi:hypothetical protein